MDPEKLDQTVGVCSCDADLVTPLVLRPVGLHVLPPALAQVPALVPGPWSLIPGPGSWFLARVLVPGPRTPASGLHVFSSCFLISLNLFGPCWIAVRFTCLRTRWFRGRDHEPEDRLIQALFQEPFNQRVRQAAGPRLRHLSWTRVHDESPSPRSPCPEASLLVSSDPTTPDGPLGTSSGVVGFQPLADLGPTAWPRGSSEVLGDPQRSSGVLSDPRRSLGILGGIGDPWGSSEVLGGPRRSLVILGGRQGSSAILGGPRGSSVILRGPWGSSGIVSLAPIIPGKCQEP